MEPTIFYKCPGQHKGPKGITYSFKGANTQEQADILKNTGWFHSLDKAIDSFKGVKEEIEQPKPKPKVREKKADS